jgi:hypothetical protein
MVLSKRIASYFIRNWKKKKDGISWLENELFKFFALQNNRAERGEISTETIKNYFKPIKRFCEMNRINLNWKIISKGIRKESDIPTIDLPPWRK